MNCLSVQYFVSVLVVKTANNFVNSILLSNCWFHSILIYSILFHYQDFAKHIMCYLWTKIGSLLIRTKSSAAHQTLYETSFSVMGPRLWNCIPWHIRAVSKHDGSNCIIWRRSCFPCRINRQSGASHHRTPILYWTGVTIEMHLLSGVVSNSDGLSSFDEADQRYQRLGTLWIVIA